MTQPTELEQAITAWSRHDPLDAGDEAALLRILERAEADVAAAGRHRSARPLWLAGGAVAASVAIALLVAPRPQPEAAPQAPSAETLAAPARSEGAAFALLYTPTVEEEYQL